MQRGAGTTAPPASQPGAQAPRLPGGPPTPHAPRPYGGRRDSHLHRAHRSLRSAAPPCACAAVRAARRTPPAQGVAVTPETEKAEAGQSRHRRRAGPRPASNGEAGPRRRAAAGPSLRRQGAGPCQGVGAGGGRSARGSRGGQCRRACGAGRGEELQGKGSFSKPAAPAEER